MALVEPVADEPAATAELADERVLLIADYHAGFEMAVRYEEGIQLPSRARARKGRLLDLVGATGADRLVILGDLTHSIGEPGGAERGEVEVLLEALDIPVTVAKGNHDGIIEEVLATDPAQFGRVDVTPATGALLGPVAIAHGHTRPNPALLEADVMCIGHEHPCVRLTDEVGGVRIERVWLRGMLDRSAFRQRNEGVSDHPQELVVFPAFNELCGGTWVNGPDQEFLAPFLPAALPRGDVYLLDGTHLGDYHEI